jgi:EAL domain-containing protein (putative c-di-GMP-specific phosphodiesterase class I)
VEIGVSVNVSARNLLEADLPVVVAGLLERTGVPATSLTLEITESVLMEDPQRALDVVSELSELGCRVSIDDFGTGYSSLAYLKKLPVDELKIDKSFVLDLPGGNAETAIVRSIIDMAHCLSLSVVAEGVETGEIWETLAVLKCDVGQGFLFARPLPAHELEAWLAAHQSASSSFERSLPTAGSPTR